jgi:hypothetical protein
MHYLNDLGFEAVMPVDHKHAQDCFQVAEIWLAPRGSGSVFGDVRVVSVE